MSHNDLHWVNTHKRVEDKNCTVLSDEFMKAMSTLYFGPNQCKVLLVLVRWTWGEGKRSDIIPLEQFEKGANMSRQAASRALSSLIRRRIITKLNGKRYEIQADIGLWCNRGGRKRI